MNRRTTFTLLSAALMVSVPARSAQRAETPAASPQEAPARLNAAQKRLVVESLAAALEAHYVFPEVGLRYAARLREQLRSGAYDDLADLAEFSARVTSDLQAVFPDRHLAMIPRRASRRGPDPADAPKSTKASGPPGLEDARMIGDVAYLRFNEFPGGASASNARSFLLAHADARAVVIDSRPNRGGRLDEMNAILPLLFSRQARLYRMEMRSDVASPFQAVPMVNAVAGSASLQRWDHTIIPDSEERRLQAVPVYYLISRRTASAAEALALGLKSTRRATLVGETTAGAGYFGGFFDVGNAALQAWVSTGRTYDPETGWDWEGKGIRPDVEAPVDEALAVALALARRAGANPGA
ncbi:MAG: S41 family peptidase [Caulobacteraceae bacterium]|nr:S41 family peptidase [Caulobacteraceae bacterium]